MAAQKSGRLKLGPLSSSAGFNIAFSFFSGIRAGVVLVPSPAHKAHITAPRSEQARERKNAPCPRHIGSNARRDFSTHVRRQSRGRSSRDSHHTEGTKQARTYICCPLVFLAQQKQRRLRRDHMAGPTKQVSVVLLVGGSGGGLVLAWLNLNGSKVCVDVCAAYKRERLSPERV